MSEIIHLRDALRLMEESMLPDGTMKPFEIEFVKYSVGKPLKNGQIAHYKNCVKQVVKQNMTKFMQRGIRDLDTAEIKTVNIWLITRFNGMRVRW